jgi:hypothetical protein
MMLSLQLEGLLCRGKALSGLSAIRSALVVRIKSDGQAAKNYRNCNLISNSERNHIMKKHFTLAGLTLLTMVSLCFGQADMKKAAKTKGKVRNQSSLDKVIIDTETALWEIVKNKQFDAFRKHYADNFLAVHSDGVTDVNQQVEGVRNLDLKDYSLSDTKVVFPNTGTAILTYKVTVQGSYQGQDITGGYYASSVWIKQGGKWLAILHTEAKTQ